VIFVIYSLNYIGPNSSLQSRLVRRGWPKLYKHNICHISRLCRTKSTLSHPT